MVALAAGAILAIGVSFFTHPYHGIRHDAILYLGQILAQKNLSLHESDLFFAYGSQASYTIFPKLFSPLTNLIPPDKLFIFATALSNLAFLGTSYLLLKKIFPSPYHYYGLLALAALPSTYGGFGLLAYNEPFFTARSIAEPLVLLALTAWTASAYASASVIAILSATIHPLQSLPVLTAMGIDLLRRLQKSLLIFLILCLCTIGVTIGYFISHNLLKRYDAEWASWVTEANSLVFMMQWPLSSWAILLSDFFLIGLLIRQSQPSSRRWGITLLITGMLLGAASLILADVMKLVWPTGLQAWRVHWLLHWLAVASIPWLIDVHATTEGWKKPHVWLLLAIIFTGTGSPPLSASFPAVALLIGLYVFILSPYQTRVRSWMLHSITVASAGVLIFLLLRHAVSAIGLLDASGGNREFLRKEFVIINNPLILAVLLFLGIKAWQRKINYRPLLFLVCTMIAIYAGANWDRRSQLTREIESAAHKPDVFGVNLPLDAQIYWPNELLGTWLVLERPNFFTGQQVSGILFNRKTAETAYQRREIVKILTVQDWVCSVLNKIQTSDDSCSINIEAVREVCSKTQGKLTHIILDKPLPIKALGSWTPIRQESQPTTTTYHLYSCADII